MMQEPTVRAIPLGPGVEVVAPAPPRTAFGRQLSIWHSLAGIVVLLLVIPFLFRMEWRNFAPFLNPLIWRNAIALGIMVTVGAAVAAIVVSLPLATGFALARLSGFWWIRLPAVLYIEGLRALPVLILILFSFYSLPPDLPGTLQRGVVAATIALTLYTAAVNAETLRASILALERGQMEAARSLALTYWQAMQYVVVPQAFRNALPPLIAQFTTLLKDTSLGSIVGMVELLSRGKCIFQTYRNPVETLYIIAVLYFVLNFGLELVSLALQKRRSLGSSLVG